MSPEAGGFADVATYIQSGNVLLATTDRAVWLTQRLERLFSKQFGYRSVVMVRSHAQLRRIVTRAPKGFGEEPSAFRYDVVFLKSPLTAAKAMKDISLREGSTPHFLDPATRT